MPRDYAACLIGFKWEDQTEMMNAHKQPSGDEIAAGQAVYTPLTLSLYDWFVLGFSNRFLWRCPTRVLEELHSRNVSSHHLDIGVGTGYFLNATTWPVAHPHITLVDLNPHSLAAAAARISEHAPETVQANALAPMPIDRTFTSISLCYLLHCLPGDMHEKAAVFDNISPLLAHDGVAFGATIVNDPDALNAPARALMKTYNDRGIFSNLHDTESMLTAELEHRFSIVRVWREGAVALFEARHG